MENKWKIPNRLINNTKSSYYIIYLAGRLAYQFEPILNPSPYARFTPEWFSWDDGYKDARKGDG